MTILYDDNMPYAEAYFSSLGEAKAFSAGHLDERDLAKCEVLLVRSTTKVDRALLAKAPKLNYVASATAGFNHLSVDELEHAGIKWYAAGGCNARAVAEYVFAALFRLAEQKHFVLKNKTLAIVGVGNVGRAVQEMATALDIHCILYDPPRAKLDKSFQSASFEDVLMADIISLHTPLVTRGEYPTHHMFDAQVLASLNAEQVLINACRGEVVCNDALLTLMNTQADKMPTLVLDCWENEPTIQRELIQHMHFATAHIAGHSIEGKANGTDMVYRDLCQHLGCDPSLSLGEFLPPFEKSDKIEKRLAQLPVDATLQTLVSESIRCMYDIENDDSFFRRYMAKSASFSQIRRDYPVRREWHAAKIKINDKTAASVLQKLGFELTNDSD